MNNFFNPMSETFLKRSLAVALAFSMLFALTRTITVICLSLSHASHSEKFVTQPHRVVKPVVHPIKLHKIEPAASTAVDPATLNGLALNSNFRSYHCLFSGHVTCNGQPCSASVQLVMASTNNPDVRRTFPTESDGSYNIDLTLSEIPHEQVDWKLSAARGALVDAEAHGRQILTDNSGLDVDQSFNLN